MNETEASAFPRHIPNPEVTKQREKKKTIYTVKHNYLAKSSYNCLLESPKRSLSWNGSVSVSILGHLH